MMRSLLTAAAVVLVSMTAAGCGFGGGPGAAPPPAAAGSAPAPALAESPAPGVPGLTGTPTDLAAPSQAQAGTGEPPTGLVKHDVVVGTGPAAAATDTVDVQYSGTLYTSGTLFDSTWTDGVPANFALDGVVPGFAQGIEGMQVGGRRAIVIPPDLGYGDRARGPIPGGSTLVFVVDLVRVS